MRNVIYLFVRSRLARDRLMLHHMQIERNFRFAMKTLILTCNTGGGHNSTSSAIKQAYENNGIECDVADALSFISTQISKIISRGHTQVYRYVPKAFADGYSFFQTSGSHHKSVNANSLAVKSIGTGAYKLHRLLQRGQYDHVICAHVFSAVMMTAVFHKYGRDVTASFVDTDYTCPPLLKNSDVDIYFIPNEGLVDEFVDEGIPRDKIVPVGIPISSDYRQRTSKDTAKINLGIDPKEDHVLLMGGSMGCGPVGNLVPKILEELPGDCVLSVVCGTNKKLFTTLSKIHNPSLRIYAYTKKIPALMDSAKLLITKPGGISISEAATKNLPLLLLDVVGGCETKNLNFFVKNGWAQQTTTATVAQDCVALLYDEPELERRRQILNTAFSRDVAMDICNYCMGISVR